MAEARRPLIVDRIALTEADQTPFPPLPHGTSSGSRLGWGMTPWFTGKGTYAGYLDFNGSE